MISLENISKSFGSTVLFENVSVAFNEKSRTGLVGVNGSGKTTLLRMLSGSDAPDRGAINKPADLSIGFLPQEVEVLDGMTPMEIVLEPFRHLLDYEQEMERLAGALQEQSKDAAAALHRMGHLHDQMAIHDGFALEARAEAILSGLGIPAAKLAAPIQTLSGGYRMRAVLGKLLLLAPDYLLLDEPTNHLDMDSLVWLEKYLSRYQGGMLVVSHDRDFLNRTTDSTAEVGNTAVRLWRGNYDTYLRLREEAEAGERSRTRNLEMRIAQAERFVERFKAKATKASQAQSRMKQLEVLRAELPQVSQVSQAIHFAFPAPPRSGTVPLKARDLAVSYGAEPVFSGLSIDINRGDKIAVVGPNGAGKSTLLKTLAGVVAPCSGSVEPGHNVTLRYFGQHQLEQLDPDLTLMETIGRSTVCTEKTFMRNVLGAFLFSGDSVDKQVRVLSGGEKSRLVLATIMANPGNVLLLDEPTNHLDLQSVEVLCDAMAEFDGTIVFVSHDDYFVSRLATRIIEMRPGMFRDFPGSLADYRTYIEAVFGDSIEQTGAGKAGATKTESDPRQARIREREHRKKLTRAIDKAERGIAELETAITALQATLDNPANGLDYELLHATGEQIAAKRESLDHLLQSWESLHSELESLGSGETA